MKILIAGFGGQGLITLKNILSYSAIKEREVFRASEIHGLSQRGGSVEIHFIKDQEVYSPLIKKGEADLIIGLDLLEAAQRINFSSRKTCFMVNNYFSSFYQLSNFSSEDFLKIVYQKTKNIFLVDAQKACLENLGNPIFAGVYLLGFASSRGLLPFRNSSLFFGIEKSVKKEFINKNKEAFLLGEKIGSDYN